MASADPILVDIREAAAIVRFNRPSFRNSLSTEVQTLLEETLSQLIGNRDIRTLIFTGTDDAFLSGADITELSTLDQSQALTFAERGQRLFQTIADTQQKTLAAINGYCMGGGLDLALACDLRIANPTAQFAHPGARLGIITGWGGTQRLLRLIGKTRAIEFFATARRLDSIEALRIGLIDVVDTSPLECALKISKSPADS